MRTWILTLASALGGCFSPDYGQGGFACTNNECPEGYACVVESAGKFCRKSGAQPDIARPDQARTDGRLAVDGKRDTARDARRDLPKVDAAPPPCVAALLVAKDTLNGIQAFDEALDGSGAPHILYVDAKLNVIDAYKPPNWGFSTLLTTTAGANQVALGRMSYLTTDRLQAVLRAPDSSIQRVWHTYRDLPSGVWVKPVVVSGTLTAVNADIAPYKDMLHIATTGKTTSPVLEIYRGFWSGSGYTFSLYASQQGDYSQARVCTASSNAAVTAFLQTGGSNTAWTLRRDPHGTGPGTQQLVAGSLSGAPGPAAVVMDSANQPNLALVRAKALGNSGALFHVTWSGAAADMPVETPVGPTNVRASSVDIVLDQTGTPVISYYDEQASEVRLARRDESGKWSQIITVAPAKTTVNTRIAVFQSTASIAFERESFGLGVDLYHTTCKLP